MRGAVPWRCFGALEPAEQLLAKVLKQAIRDARQGHNAKLRREALEFLWACTPQIAQRAGLPRLPVA